MKELACPVATDIFHILSNPVQRLKNFANYEYKKTFVQTDYLETSLPQLFKTQEEYIMDRELENFDRIFNEHKERQSRNAQKKIDSSTVAVDPLLHNLQDKKVNLVLVATSLDEKDVVKKLKGTLDPAKSSMIPLTFDDKPDTTEQSAHSSQVHCNGVENRNERDLDSRHVRRVAEQEKNERYWKRRTSNNEAAKKSRDARKLRFEWIENRTKELEVENSSLKKQLEALTKKVLEKEGKI